MKNIRKLYTILSKRINLLLSNSIKEKYVDEVNYIYNLQNEFNNLDYIDLFNSITSKPNLKEEFIKLISDAKKIKIEIDKDTKNHENELFIVIFTAMSNNFFWDKYYNYGKPVIDMLERFDLFLSYYKLNLDVAYSKLFLSSEVYHLARLYKVNPIDFKKYIESLGSKDQFEFLSDIKGMSEDVIVNYQRGFLDTFYLISKELDIDVESSLNWIDDKSNFSIDLNRLDYLYDSVINNRSIDNYIVFEDKREKYNYISDYKELNNIAYNKGYTLDRHNGDHAIFIKDGRGSVVIPQRNNLGYGLSFFIQKSIDGKYSTTW